ncbi:MAG: hypothetical protein OXG85_14290 [Chloroflexi bacterium]|nr:hypothetical protein [Chloroflexota bacterium]
MRPKLAGAKAKQLLAALLAALTLLSVASLALTQDDAEAGRPTGDPLMLALAVAREVVEEANDGQLNVIRWLYYEDDWGSLDSWRLYGSFGIDNCIAEVPVMLKRTEILFGWTFTITDVSGREYQPRVSYDLAEAVLCDEVLVPPRYGGPTSPEQAEAEAGAEDATTASVAPAAAGAARFALGGHVAGLDANAVSAMQRAGMTWVKKQVRHGGSGGGIIAQAHAQGFRVLIGALGDKNRLASDFDGYVGDYALFVAALARNGADAIEVWNEPNIEREWPRGQISGARYVDLLKVAYEAIKAANPSTLVVSGAPAPTGFFAAAGCADGGCNDDLFMQQMAQAGAANYMDCVGIHYNSGITPPQATSGAPVGSSGHYSWYLPNMMSVYRNPFPTRPLCFTELGYLTGEGIGQLPAAFNWASGISLAHQAQWLAGAVNVARSSGYVHLLVVWNVNFTTWGADPQAGYAMLRPDGSCPACDSLTAAMRA